MDDLLISYVIGDIADEDRKKVLLWISESDKNRRYFEHIRDIYSLGKSMKEPSGFDAEKSLEKIKSRYYKIRFNEAREKVVSVRVKKNQFIYVLTAAASVLLIISLGINIRSWSAHSSRVSQENITQTFNEIVSPLGSRSQVTLPDGTQVWLNAGSSLKYAMNFLENDRKVELSGEAYFDVKKSPGKKFIVNTSEIAIQVWGTKFNVKAYPDEETIQTTLVEGSISILELGDQKKKEETYLIPNQTAVFYKNSGTESSATNAEPQQILSKKPDEPVEILSEVNTILHTSWKDKNWHIEGESLGMLARELERRYNVRIRFENNDIKNYRFTGIIAEETVEQILEFIRVSAPVSFEINNNDILLTHNKGSRSKYEEYLNRQTN